MRNLRLSPPLHWVAAVMVGIGAFSASGNLYAQVTPETLDDIAACALGVSKKSRTSLNVGAAASAAARGKDGKGGGAEASIGVAQSSDIVQNLIEQLPAEQRLEGLKTIQACMKERREERQQLRGAMPPALAKLKDESNVLGNKFHDQTLRRGVPMRPSFAEEAVAIERQLEALTEGLNPRFELVRTDHRAWMLIIATEVLIAAGDTAAKAKATELTVRSQAVTQLAVRQLGPAMAFDPKWTQEQKSELVIWDRRVDALAQRYYLTKDAGLLGQLDKALANLPCDYIKANKGKGDPPLQRLGAKRPKRVAECLR